MLTDRRAAFGRLAALALGLAALLAFGSWLASAGHLDVLFDPEQLRAAVERLGVAGPIALTALLASNVILSPIPSGPMLLAAGAAFGPWAGSAIGLLGLELGSLGAFLIARWLGADAARRLAGDRLRRLEGSESALAGIVLISRLVPFLSFDLVSWAAGLTPLRTWLFALANLVGILPITVLLVLAGDGIIEGDRNGLLIAGSAVVALVLLSLLFGRRLLGSLHPARNDPGRERS